MRLKTFLLLAIAALGAGACKDDSGVTDPRNRGPVALIRFINATVDTGTVDFRFIDRVENKPQLQAVPFRGTSGGYTDVAAGTRPVRIFVNSSDPTEAKKRLIDTTITLAADRRYTLVYAGQARGNQDRLAVLEEPLTQPTPPAGSIAVRALHAELGRGNADVAIAVADTAATDPTKPPRRIGPTVATISNVAYLTLSPYTTLSALPAGKSDSLYAFAVSDAGSGVLAYRRVVYQRGIPQPAGASYGPQPGVQIPGSVLTAVLLAGATPGSKAATAANQTPTVILLIDKVLNP